MAKEEKCEEEAEKLRFCVQARMAVELNAAETIDSMSIIV
jgi:hypothetical protein